MAGEQIRKVYLDEDEDFSERQSYGRRVVTPVRYSTDPRDVGWVRQNIPCQTACPADTNVPAYIQMILENRYGRSYELNRIANVLPGTLGRICSRPCEDACRHGWPGNGAPVNICHLKRAAADHKPGGHRITENLFTPSGKRIAVVGAGSAGIAAAHDLSMLGHDVTIFEQEKIPGGMLYYGIPEFRLPRDVLAVEVRNALRLGVDLRAGVAVGKGEGEVRLSSLLEEYDAVLLATGCMAAIRLPLRGVDDAAPDPVRRIPNAEYGLDFLMELHRGEPKTVGKRVAVVGAGFTALDCARVSLRLGAEDVTIHMRTTEEYIPVTKEEIHEAKREGTKILGLRTPVGLITDDDGRLTGVQFVQNRLGGWRAGGRRQAIPIEGSEFVEPCDTLLVAIGQKTVNDYLDVEVELDRWGAVQVDERGMTSVEGLFAAGDFVIGASTVVEAVGLWAQDRAQDGHLADGPRAAQARGQDRDRGGAATRSLLGLHPAAAHAHGADEIALRYARARGREGLRPGSGGGGGQALLSLPPQVRDRSGQLHLLPGVHRGRAARLHQAGERRRDQGGRQLRRAAGDQPVGPGRRDLDRQQPVHPLRRLLHGLPDQMHFDHQERNLLSGRMRRSRPSGRWRQTTTT